jgi:hypothetical protein
VDRREQAVDRPWTGRRTWSLRRPPRCAPPRRPRRPPREGRVATKQACGSDLPLRPRNLRPGLNGPPPAPTTREPHDERGARADNPPPAHDPPPAHVERVRALHDPPPGPAPPPAHVGRVRALHKPPYSSATRRSGRRACVRSKARCVTAASAEGFFVDLGGCRRCGRAGARLRGPLETGASPTPLSTWESATGSFAGPPSSGVLRTVTDPALRAGVCPRMTCFCGRLIAASGAACSGAC